MMELEYSSSYTLVSLFILSNLLLLSFSSSHIVLLSMFERCLYVFDILAVLFSSMSLFCLFPRANRNDTLFTNGYEIFEVLVLCSNSSSTKDEYFLNFQRAVSLSSLHNLIQVDSRICSSYQGGIE